MVVSGWTKLLALGSLFIFNFGPFGRNTLTELQAHHITQLLKRVHVHPIITILEEAHHLIKHTLLSRIYIYISL